MIKQIPILAALFLMLAAQNIAAQVNNDSIFQTAIEQSKAKNYARAVAEAEKVLTTDPNRVDVLLFVARIYSWQHQYDKSKSYINRAFTLDNTNEELYDLWLNILLWNKEAEELSATCDLAESHHYQNKYNLFVKRLQSEELSKNYKAIVKTVKNESGKAYFDSAQVKNLYREALSQSQNQFVSAYYSMDFFDKGEAQHLAYLDYSFKIGEDRIIFRANAAHRYGMNGLQLESDFYKTLNKKEYMYFNYGYSIDNVIFPLHRAGYEFYFPIKTFEASLGARYMRFPQKNVFIGTGSLSKYFGNNYLTFRPFYIHQDIANSFALIGNYRKYADNALAYWGVEAGYGNSPDDRFALTQTNQFLRLSAYRFKLEKNFVVGKTNELRIGAAYADEEFIKGSFRNRYTIELIYKIKL